VDHDEDSECPAENPLYMGLDNMRTEMLFQVVVKDGNKNKH